MWNRCITTLNYTRRLVEVSLFSILVTHLRPTWAGVASRKSRFWCGGIGTVAQDDELVHGTMAMENSGVATASSFVDESRLRRYNCGLRSETRGNLRERCLFPSQCIGVFVALLVWERAVAMARRSELIFEQISFKFFRDKCNA